MHKIPGKEGKVQLLYNNYKKLTRPAVVVSFLTNPFLEFFYCTVPPPNPTLKQPKDKI
jgi:hypothetical protein